MSVASHGYLKNHKSYFEKLPKNLKMTPLIVENEFPKKIKSLIYNGTRFSQPNYHILR